MSYNIHSGKNMDNVLDIPAIAQVVRELAPEICALNEVRMRTIDVGGKELAKEIADEAGMYWRFGRAIYYNGGEYGNAILSRAPISFSRVVPVPDVPEEERERRFEPRSVLEAIVLTDKGPVQALTCHFGLTRGEQERAVETVLSMLRSDMPAVFMGDLNILPDNDLIAKLREKIRDTAGAEPFTFPARDACSKIDYIFASEHFACGEFTTVQTLASDHLPAYVDAELA
ncbi:MAG: endonuclease/exonuclease/phosphatase family protein [Eubacteriales bacterium]|nr:endonuclease/exonuclease/phosphatase family protein [Eubacteriales bacterium]